MKGHVITLILLLTSFAWAAEASAQNAPSAPEKEYIEMQTAIRDGNLAAIRALLEKGANVNAADESGDTALMRASLSGKLEAIKLLLHKGANINAADVNGRTALMRASSQGNLDAVKLLLEKGADVNAADKSGNTVLVAACHGNLEVVKLLLEKGADVNAISSNGEALDSAIASKDIDLVRFLLSKGARIEVPGSKRLLVVRGRDMQTIDYSGYTPLMNAYDKLEILRILLETMAVRQPEGSVMPLFCAAGLGDEKAVLAALDKGDSLSDKTCGFFPLSLACLMGNSETATLLLDKGADIEGKDLFGNSPLRWAIAGGYPAVVKLLLEKGANVGADKLGDTALMVASSNGNLEVVKVLLEKGGDVNVGEYPALMRAVASGNSETAKLLLEKGANANIVDALGRTVLMMACYGGKIDVVETLLRHGANPNLQTSDGSSRSAQRKKTVLEQMVTGYGCSTEEGLQIIQLLLDYGANPDAPLSTGSGDMTIMQYCRITNARVHAIMEKHMKQSGRELSNLLDKTDYDDKTILESLTQAQADLPDFLAHATPERKKELFSLANSQASKARLYLGELNESARVEIANGGTGESFRKRAVVVNEYIRLLDEIKASLSAE